MHEVNPTPKIVSSTEETHNLVAVADHASGWRAFFSVLFMGLCVSGSARPDPADYDTRYKWMQAVTAISACSFGALVASFFAIKFRKLASYWSIVWRLYLVYIVGASLAGGMPRGIMASYATGAVMVAGFLTALSGTALFYWRNAGTNIFFYVFSVLFGIGVIRVIML